MVTIFIRIVKYFHLKIMDKYNFRMFVKKFNKVMKINKVKKINEK